jgi:hypothetical protein
MLYTLGYLLGFECGLLIGFTIATFNLKDFITNVKKWITENLREE